MRVTAIERQRRRKRVNLFLDGRFALGLSLEVAAQAGLRVGDEISQETLQALQQAEAQTDAIAAGLRLLSYRPRSEAELRQRLTRRGTPAPLVDAAVKRLREMGLLDDAAFVRAWVESRDRASPRGRRLLQQELRAKGVDADISREPVERVDELDAALRAAVRRAASLRRLPYEEFQRRLGDFLARRGFDYETIHETVQRCWREEAELGAESDRTH